MTAQYTALEYHAGDKGEYRYTAESGFYAASSDDHDLFDHAQRAEFYGVGCDGCNYIGTPAFAADTHAVVRICNRPHCGRRAAFSRSGEFTYCCVHGIVERSGYILGDGCDHASECVCAAPPCICGGAE